MCHVMKLLASETRKNVTRLETAELKHRKRQEWLVLKLNRWCASQPKGTKNIYSNWTVLIKVLPHAVVKGALLRSRKPSHDKSPHNVLFPRAGLGQKIYCIIWVTDVRCCDLQRQQWHRCSLQNPEGREIQRINWIYFLNRQWLWYTARFNLLTDKISTLKLKSS